MEIKKYKINPDKEKVKEVTQAIRENNGYCPCSLIKTEETKCVCKTTRETGECECQLYVKNNDIKEETKSLIKDLKSENYDRIIGIQDINTKISQLSQEKDELSKIASNADARIQQLENQIKE